MGNGSARDLAGGLVRRTHNAVDGLAHPTGPHARGAYAGVAAAGWAMDLAGVVGIHNAGLIHGGTAAMVLGFGGIWVHDAPTAPSSSNRIGIRSQSLRRVLIGSGAVAMAASSAAMAATGTLGIPEVAALVAGGATAMTGLVSGF